MIATVKGDSGAMDAASERNATFDSGVLGVPPSAKGSKSWAPAGRRRAAVRMMVLAKLVAVRMACCWSVVILGRRSAYAT